MRLRDIKYYIFVALFLCLLYFMFTAIYFISSDSIRKESSMSQLDSNVDSKISMIDSRIMLYESMFIKGEDDPSINYFDFNYDIYGDFNNELHLIAPQNKYVVGGYNEEVLFICNDSKIAYVELNNLFSGYNSDEFYTLYNKYGEILCTNKAGFVNQRISDYYNINDNEFNSFRREVDGSLIKSVKYDDIYFLYEVNSTGNTLGVDKILTQAILFFVGAIITFGLMFVVIIFGVRRASRLILIDKYNFNKAQSVVLKVNKNGKVVFANKVFKGIFNYSNPVKNVLEFEAIGDNDIIKCVKKELNFYATLKYLDTLYYFNLTSIYSHGYYYLIGFDDTKQYVNNQYLVGMLSKNELTGLDNHLSLTANFMDVLKSNEKKKVSMALMNIVGFREINKVFGRRVGDKILIYFSKLLIDNFPSMRVYHMEADKFIIVISDEAEYKGYELCEKFLTILKTPLYVSNNHIFVKAKVGIYNFNEDDDAIALDTVVNKMDVSLRRAMNTATKDIVIYDKSIETYVVENNKMEMDLLNAIDNDEFEMFLQPQYDIFAERIVSFEALIRWRNPLYARQSPQIFIEMAENNGFILEIGRFVIEQSFKIAKRLEQYNCHVSINVSPAQLLQAGFVGDLINEFEANELKPGSIAIEITETFVMENFDVMVEKLDTLRKRGFSIHLDDFGTGYSSMLYLRELPADVLKIDKEFTKHIESDNHSRVIVNHICSIGHELGLDIICEGVETVEQSNMLKKMGCRIIQGWLIGKAMPVSDAIELIHKTNIEKEGKKSKKRR